MKPVTIDYDLLSARCKMEREEFNHPDYGEYVPLIRSGYDTYSSFYDPKTKTTTRTPKHVEDEETFYIYKDNGAKVLAVAHLDTVVSTWSNWTFERAVLGSNRNKETCIFNAQLDDRLGVYILLDLLPLYLGDKAYDILLTNDEEVSASTAADFIPPEGKEYNWIFQFDRRGTGAVLYDYEDAAWRAVVAEDFRVDVGSYSDICKLYKLGVKGLNVGTGYHDEHNDLCYMVEEEVTAQIERFIRFFRRNQFTKFPHVHTVRKSYYGGAWNDEDWDGYDYRLGGYWDGTKWVSNANVSGSTIPNTASRFPPTGAAGTNVIGAPKRNSGLTRIHSRPLSDDLDDDDEANIDNEYGGEDSFDARDYVSNNELKMLAAITDSMSNYDTDGNYVGKDEIYVKAKTYESLNAYDWFELPAVYKVNTLMQYADFEKQYLPTMIPIYHSRVNGRKCTYCKSCSVVHEIEDVFWTTDAVPMCVDCLSTLPAGTEIRSTPPDILGETEDIAWEVPLTDPQIQWLAEGGGIRMGSAGVKRSLVGVDDKIERCYCSICGQPEWADKMVKFTNPLFKSDDKADVCRDCFDVYQAGEDNTFWPTSL